MNRRLLSALAGLSMVLIFTSGCDDDDFDHEPPAGMGCIIVRNNTYHDLNVFINGGSTNQARENSHYAYDLNPGVYRVVLDQEDGDRNYRDDIDVIRARRTILDVTDDPLRFDRYDVYVYFD